MTLRVFFFQQLVDGQIDSGVGNDAQDVREITWGGYNRRRHLKTEAGNGYTADDTEHVKLV